MFAMQCTSSVSVDVAFIPVNTLCCEKIPLISKLALVLSDNGKMERYPSKRLAINNECASRHLHWFTGSPLHWFLALKKDAGGFL